MSKKWSKFEIEKAITLNQKGLKFIEIAEEFNFTRTVKAIKVKLNKLGYYENSDNPYVDLSCLECGNSFSSLKKEKRKFCSKNCSASYNNKKRKKSKFCLNCNGELDSHQKKYCSHTCMQDLIKKENFIEIENGSASMSNDICKKYLIEKYGERCCNCGWCEIHPITKKVPIQLNHIDGNSDNNIISNLELLCPNCHSLTPNFGILNKGNGRKKRKEKRIQDKKKFGFYI